MPTLTPGPEEVHVIIFAVTLVALALMAAVLIGGAVLLRAHIAQHQDETR